MTMMSLGLMFFIMTSLTLFRPSASVESIWVSSDSSGADDVDFVLIEPRVTDGEARVVNRLENLDEVLQPVVERFGAGTASQVEKQADKQPISQILGCSFEPFNLGNFKIGFHSSDSPPTPCAIGTTMPIIMSIISMGIIAENMLVQSVVCEG
jgi:hypothetical protein